MNSVYVCRKCKAAFTVPVLDPQAHLMKKSMRCPHSDICGGKIHLTTKTNIKLAFPSTPMGALELYQASLGVGVPKERRCSPTDIKKALVGAKIVDIKTDPAGDPKRTIIYSLTLDSGKVIHFAHSTKGATIFKVTDVR